MVLFRVALGKLDGAHSTTQEKTTKSGCIRHSGTASLNDFLRPKQLASSELVYRTQHLQQGVYDEVLNGEVENALQSRTWGRHRAGLTGTI
jgi:hypothetical protein